MLPISDENPTLRTPIVTIALLVVMGLVWVVVQQAGTNPYVLAATVCDWGLVPGEITGRAPLGEAVPIGNGLACAVDADPMNWLTPLTAMFLHGSWMHILGNGWFLWIFGNNVEDSMGRLRFLVFYLICGLAAAALQTIVQPDSIVPMVGASGAIAGVLGGYLVLYPRVRVRVLIPLFLIWPIVSLPAWTMLLWWIGLQVISAIPELMRINPDVSSGVAFFAHIGGFVAGIVLVRLFANRVRVARRNAIRHEMHPMHP